MVGEDSAGVLGVGVEEIVAVVAEAEGGGFVGDDPGAAIQEFVDGLASVRL